MTTVINGVLVTMVGVRYEAVSNRWRAYANIDGKQKNLGSFKTPEEAYEARKNHENKKRGYNPDEISKIESITPPPYRVKRDGVFVWVKPAPIDIETYREKLFGKSSVKPLFVGKNLLT